MLHRSMSRVLLAGSTFLVLASWNGLARADIFLETAYVPTSSVVLPTSSILSTSYVVPTAYTTSYLPTSSVYSVGEVMTTSATYVPTYRTVRYRPRRYVERTSYLAAPAYSLAPTSYVMPTSYLLPTSYVVPSSYVSSSFITPTSYLLDTGLVTTSASSVNCDPVVTAPARSSATQSPSSAGSGGGNTITSQPTASGGTSSERRPSGTVDDGTPSNVTPPVPAPANSQPKSAPVGSPSTLPQPGPIDTGAPAVAPGATGTGNDDIKIPPPGSGPRSDETFRSAQRPTTYDVRNILRGRVVSFDSGRPEEGVTVVVSSRTQNFTDRPAMTDADGEFKVSLPDGDWTVRVKMPSGTLYPVGRDFLTASAGRIIDASGRSVKEFLITR